MEAVKSGAESFFQIKLDHHILGDLPAFGSPVLQAVPPRLHFPNAALKSGGEGLVGEGGSNDRREDFMQVREPLDGIQAALEKAGIQFIDENGGRPGVRLRKRQRAKP
jgi:hypothetical protein